LPGLKHDRSLVLAGGLAIMMAAFKELNIKIMGPGEGALRVGVLYDLLGRDSDHDKRHETVRQFIKRYHVDVRQAARVKQMAMSLFRQLELADDTEVQELERTLAWAADLHEIGMSIAHAEYHKHSAYILQHADMPGFSNDDQLLLAKLALGHHGKLSKFPTHEPTRNRWLTLLCLRLAVLLARRREDLETLPLSISAKGNKLRIKVDRNWLATRPLSEYSLLTEQEEWNKGEFSFELCPK